jgi:transcription elongation factor Elf1
MGKRKKSTRKPGAGKKKMDPLPTVFTCLFCNHERSIVVKLDKKTGIGSLFCKVCAKTFETRINYLAAPTDVYHEWVDACNALNQDPSMAAASAAGPSGRDEGRRQAGAAAERADDVGVDEDAYDEDE